MKICTHHDSYTEFDRNIVSGTGAWTRVTCLITTWGWDKMAAFCPDTIFKRIFLNKNVWISINVSLKFNPKGPINNIPELVQIMVCHRPGNKPLSEPMMVSLLMDICVTRPQWVTTRWCTHLINVKNRTEIIHSKTLEFLGKITFKLPDVYGEHFGIT